MAMPAKHREGLLEECDGQLVATIDTQSRCLMIYPLPTWQEIEKQLQDLPALNPAARRLQRLMLGYASDLEFDSNGRMLLPQALRDYAQLEKKAVLIGQAKRFELWSEELWAKECSVALEEAAGGELPLPDEVLSLSL